MAESGSAVAGGGKAGKGPDLYEVLGVPKTATEKQITSAYRKLALR
jgi:preprotein translocase subunit Sec63